jgi:8-oxo-dGTP diphosphatase
VVFTMRADDLAVLLIRRGEEPFKGQWALPGGHVEADESLAQAAARELEEETGVANARLEQLAAFGNPGRDPRGHYVTVAFYTFALSESVKPRPGDDAAEVEWHSLRDIDLDPARSIARRGRTAKVTLAFDHAEILRTALKQLRTHLENPGDVRFRFVPMRFTIAELHRVYEVISGRALDKRAFNRWLAAKKLVVPVAGDGKAATGVSAGVLSARRPAARLFRWNG